MELIKVENGGLEDLILKKQNKHATTSSAFNTLNNKILNKMKGHFLQ